MPKQQPVAAGVAAAKTAAPGTLTARNIASILGRNQGPELIFQQQFIPLASPFLPQNLNLNRPMERIHIVFQGRVTVTGADYTAVAAEAPQTILQRVRLTGTHRVFNALVPLDMSGATIFVYPRLFRQRGCSEYINGVRQPEPNVPFFQIPATFGAIGVYDLEIHYDIPLTPILPPSSKLGGIPFLFMEADWANTLQLQLFMGDSSSFGTPAGGTAVAFTAFGSNAGSPLFTILANYEILGPLAGQIQGAVVVRNEQLQTANVASAGQNLQLQLLQKQKTTNVVIKTGQLLAGTSPGVQVYATLTDQLLEQTQIQVDNKPVRNNFLNAAAKEYAGFAFDTVLPEGYLNFSFIDSTNPLTYYRGDKVAGGSTFQVQTQVKNTLALAAANIVQEQVFGTPGGVTPTVATAASGATSST
jgi:hypothetical protein